MALDILVPCFVCIHNNVIIIITIVQSYTGKYHKFVAIFIVVSAHNANSNKQVIFFFFSIVWYYGDNDFMIRTLNFIVVQTQRT